MFFDKDKRYDTEKRRDALQGCRVVANESECSFSVPAIPAGARWPRVGLDILKAIESKPFRPAPRDMD
jgi:hypothetical protein